MVSYNAPLYWFGPQSLHRWLWENSSLLSYDTVEGFHQLLRRAEGSLDVHKIVQHIILTADYASVLGCLDRGEFRAFIDSCLRAYQDRIEKDHPNCTVRLTETYPRIETKLQQAYAQANLRPRSSLMATLASINQAKSQIRNNLDLATAPGSMQSQAQAQLRHGCDSALEGVEKILDLILDFMTKLLYFCQNTPRLPGNRSWGSKELDTHNAASQILTKILEDDMPRKTRHLILSLKNFASLWYGTDISNEKKRHFIRFSDGSEYPRGQIMTLLGTFRRWRNDISHASQTIEWSSQIPESLIEVAREIGPKVEEFVALCTCDYFPELVRITAYKVGVNSHELYLVVTPGVREYVAIFSDPDIMNKLARDATSSLACTQGDQDYWLFPAPLDHQARILNPLLLPCGNHKDYEKFVGLKVEPSSPTMAVSSIETMQSLPEIGMTE